MYVSVAVPPYSYSPYYGRPNKLASSIGRGNAAVRFNVQRSIDPYVVKFYPRKGLFTGNCYQTTELLQRNGTEIMNFF